MTQYIALTHKNRQRSHTVPNGGQVDRAAAVPSTNGLAASLTRSASAQTYYTVRFLVDRGLIQDAYRAYAYFRWVDDTLDQDGIGGQERTAFADRQVEVIDGCYRGKPANGLSEYETMAAELIRNDRDENSGLQAYIRNMLAVMVFDANRRDHLVSQAELAEYTSWLAISVTEALHYFIGHNSYSPHSKARYLAATAAHISHMLRDTFEDVGGGYFNIPSEVLDATGITPQDISSDPYRAWVRSRVRQARVYFNAGRDYLAQVQSFRCRMAGYAYIARFEWVLDAIERDEYILQPHYTESNQRSAGVRMVLSAFLQAKNLSSKGWSYRPLSVE